jgi:hypothetical protein
MSRYFFDTHDGKTLLEGDTGQDLDGIEANRVEAQTALADMIRDAQRDGSQRTVAVRVRNETGKTVIKAAVSVLVEVEC